VRPPRLALALLLSGAGSLLQQVAWNRSWVLVFGAGTGVGWEPVGEPCTFAWSFWWRCSPWRPR
jgi:hypothetical protein